jgi:hypothetical protein
MDHKASELNLVIGAMLKLDPHNGERPNVMAYIQSCFGGRVRDYDLDAALVSLDKLSNAEHHALVEYVLRRG